MIIIGPIIAAAMFYDDFTMMIQSGISRKTYWGTKTVSLVLITFGITIINVLYELLIMAPLGWIKWSFFTDWTKGFGYTSSLTTGGLSYFILLFFGLMMVIASFMAIGSFLAIFNRIGKLIVLILAPMVFVTEIVTLVKVGKMVPESGIRYFFTLTFGYNEAASSISLVNVLSLLVLYIVIMLAISYVCTKFLRVRR